MRAEVGLLSRNVVIKGDATSKAALYGGHMMFKGDKVEARISNVEFLHMGQAYQVSRHPVAFTESLSLSKSYVKHSAIREGFNRAVAIHAANCLLVESNVAF